MLPRGRQRLNSTLRILTDSLIQHASCHMEQYRQDLGGFDELKTTEQFSKSGILYRGSEM
jgi:hypothetical protein